MYVQGVICTGRGSMNEPSMDTIQTIFAVTNRGRGPSWALQAIVVCPYAWSRRHEGQYYGPDSEFVLSIALVVFKDQVGSFLTMRRVHDALSTW